MEELFIYSLSSIQNTNAQILNCYGLSGFPLKILNAKLSKVVQSCRPVCSLGAALTPALELGLDPLRDDALTVFAMAGGVCRSGVLPLDHYYYYYYEQLSEKFHVMIW